MDNGRIMKELKELQEGVKNVSLPIQVKLQRQQSQIHKNKFSSSAFSQHRK